MRHLPFFHSRIKHSERCALPLSLVYTQPYPCPDLNHSTAYGEVADEAAWPVSIRTRTSSDVITTLNRWGFGSVGSLPVVSDRVARVLRTLRLGKNELRKIPVIDSDDRPTGDTVWALATMEQLATAVAAEGGEFSLNGLRRNKIFSELWDNAWQEPPEGTSVPCRPIESEIDIWVDPLWRGSLFFSRTLVDAIDAYSERDHLALVLCREATIDEIKRDMTTTLR